MSGTTAVTVFSIGRLLEALVAVTELAGGGDGIILRPEDPVSLELGPARRTDLFYVTWTCYQGRFTMICTGDPRPGYPPMGIGELRRQIKWTRETLSEDKPVTLRAAGKIYGLAAVTAEGGLEERPRWVLHATPGLLPEEWAGVTVT